LSTVPIELKENPEQVIRTPANSEFRIELPERDGRRRGLTDADIIDQIRRLRQEAIDRNQLIMDRALECWEQYRNEQDFSDKASWESRITLAKGHAAVKHFVANILRLLTQSEQWVSVEDVGAENPLMQLSTGVPSFAPFVERGVLKLADNAGFKEPLREALEFAGATMFGALKVIWQHTPTWHTTIEQGEQGLQLRQQQKLAGKLGIYSLDPWRVHFGPRTQGGSKRIDFIIEDSDADLADLISLGGFENLGEFLEQDRKPSSTDDPSYEDRHSIREANDAARVRRRIELWDFWGSLIDPETQETVAEDMHIIVGNGEQIVKYGENQLWDKKPPYILFSPLIVAGRFPGGGILEMNLEIKRAIDRIAQMWETHLHFSVLPMWEAELSALENPEDAATGVFPGKIFRKKIGLGQNQVFRPLLINPLGADSFNTVIAFDKEYQRGTFITEQTQGLIDAKGETTATEIQQTAFASTLILADMAAHLELECLSPLGEMIWDRMFQFMDITSLPNWSMLIGGNVGQFLDNLPQQLRMEFVRGLYVFKARGLSRVIERSQQRNALLQWVQTVSQLGPAQVFVNIPVLIQRIHESFHIPNAEELLVPNWQQVLAEFQTAMLQAANPVVQQQSKQQGTMQQIAAETDQVVAQETVKGQAALVREALKGEIATQIASQKSKER